MKIATWNVNSIRSRLERLLNWLEQLQPDVVCLQELKVTDEAFPYDPVRAAGYHATVYGQKTYNGVAILSRVEPAVIEKGFGDGADDPQARLLRAEIGGIQVITVYAPNGQVVGSPAYAFKMQWFQRLRAYLEQRYSPEAPVIIAGDLNVARDEKDVAHAAQWVNTVLFDEGSRQSLEHLLSWGLVDVFRGQHGDGGLYSWWDYRMLAFPKNNGLRLDYILSTEALAKKCVTAEIDREERKGEKPSDHAPVVATFTEQDVDGQ